MVLTQSPRLSLTTRRPRLLMSMRSPRQLTQITRRPRLLTRNTATTVLLLTRRSTLRLLTLSMRPRQLTRTTRQRRTQNMGTTARPLTRRSTLHLLTLSMRLLHPLTLSTRPRRPTPIMKRPRLPTQNTSLLPSTSTAHLPTQSTRQSQRTGEITRSPRLRTLNTLPARNILRLHTQDGKRPQHLLTLNTRRNRRSGQVTDTPSLLMESGKRAARLRTPSTHQPRPADTQPGPRVQAMTRHLLTLNTRRNRRSGQVTDTPSPLTESGKRAARLRTPSTHQPRPVDTQPGPRLQATSQSTLRKLLARRVKYLTTRLLFPQNTLPRLPVPRASTQLRHPHLNTQPGPPVPRATSTQPRHLPQPQHLPQPRRLPQPRHSPL
jgi:hypothetical protein